MSLYLNCFGILMPYQYTWFLIHTKKNPDKTVPLLYEFQPTNQHNMLNFSKELLIINLPFFVYIVLKNRALCSNSVLLIVTQCYKRDKVLFD